MSDDKTTNEPFNLNDYTYRLLSHWSLVLSARFLLSPTMALFWWFAELPSDWLSGTKVIASLLCFHVFFEILASTSGFGFDEKSMDKWTALLLFVVEPWIMLIKLILGGLIFLLIGSFLTGGLSFFG
jgi:hypothetical protein